MTKALHIHATPGGGYTVGVVIQRTNYYSAQTEAHLREILLQDLALPENLVKAYMTAVKESGDFQCQIP
jgi:hypothetical protein